MSNNMNKSTQLEITSDFEQFKIGFINKLINNYKFIKQLK